MADTTLLSPAAAARWRRAPAACFGLCFVFAAALFLPFLIIDKGFFLYCGDFNSQQLPFTYYMEGLIKNGLPRYAWATDLGSGFVESYSFYLLGSPFFWLGCLLPQAWAPWLLAPLLCLKFAVAGAGACLWARRWVAGPASAQLVGVLYAFSGAAIYNIFFNHFVDVIAVFPFLLWAADECYAGRRRCVLAPMAALCLCVNYFFFVGQVVFLLVYFLIRIAADGWRRGLKRLPALCWEGALGAGMAMAIALPSLLAVLRNPRVDSFYYGLDILFYWRTQQYLALGTSALLPQDPSYLPNLFPNAAIKWTSMSLYLPLMALCGVITYLKTFRRRPLGRMLITFAVMALVPVLNAAFYAFNSSYYCRWFYMPLLLMALASTHALEKAPRSAWLGSIRLCGALTAAYMVFALLPARDDAGGFRLGIEADPARLFLTLALALGSLALLYRLALCCRSREKLIARCTLCAGALGAVIGIYTVACGKLPQRYGDADYKMECYDYRQELADWLNEADENYYRIDTYESYTNLGLWLDRSCLQFFNSTVDASILEFYPTVGVTRDVSSKPEIDEYALRGLLNVRYLLTPSDRVTDFYDEVPFPEDWLYTATVGPYAIMEYRLYVPFGSTYEYYVTPEQFAGLAEHSRALLLMRALLLEEEQAAMYQDYIRPLPQESLSVMGYAAYREDAALRAVSAAQSFKVDGNGFTAHILTPAPRLVFFSVPYNSGWHATVNGVPATVERVDNGLCAVAVAAGESDIRFDYRAPGAQAGAAISAVCIAVWAAWAAWCACHRRPKVPLAPIAPLPQWLPPLTAPEGPTADGEESTDTVKPADGAENADEAECAGETENADESEHTDESSGEAENAGEATSDGKTAAAILTDSADETEIDGEADAADTPDSADGAENADETESDGEADAADTTDAADDPPPFARLV